MESLPPEKRISKDQAEILINSMYEAQKTVQTEKGPGVNISSPSDLTEETLAQMMERSARINEKYVEISRGMMTPEQVEQYKTFLKQRLDMTESVLKMSLNLYGGKTDQKNEEEAPE